VIITLFDYTKTNKSIKRLISYENTFNKAKATANIALKPYKKEI